jgi:hypothetical protein
MASEEAFEELQSMLEEEIADCFDRDLYDEYADKYFSEEQVGKWLYKKLSAELEMAKEDWIGGVDGLEPLTAPTDDLMLERVKNVNENWDKPRKRKKKLLKA